MIPLQLVVPVLIMHQTVRVGLLDPAARSLEVLPVAGLVAQGPDQDAGVVLVPHDVHHGAIHGGLGKHGVAGGHAVALGERPLDVRVPPGLPCGFDVDQAHRPMGFQIRLRDQVKAVLVGQLGHPGGVRVVGGADGVDVVFLHQPHVPDQLLPADGVAGDGVGVVAVGAPELDGLAVHGEDDLILYLHHADADLLADHLVRRFQPQGIKVRRFSGPLFRLRHEEGNRIIHDVPALHLVAAGAEQSGLHLRFPGQAEVHPHRAVGVALVQRGMDKKVPDVVFRPLQEIQAPENAGHAQLVLVLQVGAVAPFEHGDGQAVFPLRQPVGQVELVGRMADLAVAGEPAVDPEVKAAVHPFEVQVVPHARLFVQADQAAVDPSGVFLGHIGRVKGEGIIDVGVLVAVVAVVLPDARHRDHVVKLLGIFPAVLRHVVHAVIVFELPFPVQRDHPGRAGPGFVPRRERDIVGAVFLRAQVQDGRVLKVFFLAEHGFLLLFSC